MQFGGWVEQRFNSQVLEMFTAEVEPDWLTWLDARQAVIDGHQQDSVALFEKEVLSVFRGIRVFHATRLSSIEPILRQGLRAWSADDLRQQAVERFSDRVPLDRITQAMQACNPEHRSGRVYSFASAHHALGQPANGYGGKLQCFCLHGGEFLACVSAHLQLDEAHPENARPYLFACNLPWQHLDANDANWIAKTILLSVLTNGYLEGEWAFPGQRECISTEHNIPPEDIQSFASLEMLIGREDLQPTDISWQAFPRLQPTKGIVQLQGPAEGSPLL
jgi:hypothetical protein